MRNHVALLEQYVSALFTTDAEGRLLESNEPFAPARRPAPKVYAGWNADGLVVRTRFDVPAEIEQELRSVTGIDDLRGYPYLMGLTPTVGGPIYVVPEVLPSLGDTVPITAENVELARETFPWLIDEVDQWGPCQAVTVNGEAVAICFSARIGQDCEIAGLETAEHARGRGYAGAVTVGWARAVRAAGRVPFYSTSADNVASQAVARKLGLIQIGVDQSWD